MTLPGYCIHVLFLPKKGDTNTSYSMASIEIGAQGSRIEKCYFPCPSRVGGFDYARNKLQVRLHDLVVQGILQRLETSIPLHHAYVLIKYKKSRQRGLSAKTKYTFLLADLRSKVWDNQFDRRAETLQSFCEVLPQTN